MYKPIISACYSVKDKISVSNYETEGENVIKKKQVYFYKLILSVL
jgi:hypothetical protein